MLKNPSLQNKTTDVVIHQHSRKLLKMDILMSETCWAHNKWNEIASDIKWVFHSSADVCVCYVPCLLPHSLLCDILLNLTSSCPWHYSVNKARWMKKNSRWGRNFPPVQTGPGAHPASCKMDTGSFPGVKCGRGVLLTTHRLLVPRSWKSRAILLPTLWTTPSL